MGDTHDEPSFAASPNTTRTLTECPVPHTNAFLLGEKGVRFLSAIEINTSGCFAFKRKSEIFFLLSAKGSRFSFGRQKKQKRQGAVFRVRPLQPENSSYPPTKEKRARGEQPPPYLRGQRGAVNKRTNEMGTSARAKTWSKQKTGRSYAIKADGKKCRPLFMNYNFSSLSRARKILRASLANFFGAVP